MPMLFSPFNMLLIILTIVSCGKKNSNDDTSTGTPSPATKSPSTATDKKESISDTSQAGISSFLKALTYQSWAIHHENPVASATAHRQWVKSYFNAAVTAALAADEELMPVGSAIVKEMYDSDRRTLLGQAVMIKVTADAGQDSWLYFEGDLPSYSEATYGAGHSSCTSCHSVGSDFVRSSLP